MRRVRLLRPAQPAQPLLNIQMVMGGTPHFRLDGAPVFGMAGAGTFAEEMIIPHQGVVKIDDDIPLEIGSLVGCGVMTGVGAAINTAKVTPGLLGRRVRLRRRGDLLHHGRQGRRRLGRSWPSTSTTGSSRTAKALRRHPRLQARRARQPQGQPHRRRRLRLLLRGHRPAQHDAGRLRRHPPRRHRLHRRRRQARRVRAASPPSSCSSPRRSSSARYYGSADVRTDFHKLLGFYKDGSLDLAGMITRRIKLDEINDAFGAMERGEVIRQVISF